MAPGSAHLCRLRLEGLPSDGIASGPADPPAVTSSRPRWCTGTRRSTAGATASVQRRLLKEERLLKLISLGLAIYLEYGPAGQEEERAHRHTHPPRAPPTKGHTSQRHWSQQVSGANEGGQHDFYKILQSIYARSIYKNSGKCETCQIFKPGPFAYISMVDFEVYGNTWTNYISPIPHIKKSCSGPPHDSELTLISYI